MPLTDAEFDFLDAYVHEVYAPAMTGPHTQAVRVLGCNQSDLAWLLTAWHRQALAEGKNPLGSPHPKPVPLPWSATEDLLARGRELRKELEQPGKPVQSLSG
jgi:hypothetical protein